VKSSAGAVFVVRSVGRGQLGQARRAGHDPDQVTMARIAMTRHITRKVAASARLRRAPGYTAPKTCGSVNALVEVGQCMAEERSCWRRVGNL